MDQITHRTAEVRGLVIKSAIGGQVTIAGYASVYNVADKQNDLIMKGAFNEAKPDNIKLLWQHDVQKPIGLITMLSEDDYGLKVEAVINDKISVGREAIELIRQGAIDSLSIGFYIKLSNYNEHRQRIITKAELLEVSVVTFPANLKAKISYITKQLTNQKEDLMDHELIVSQPINNQLMPGQDKQQIEKLKDLEEKMNNIQTYLSRPSAAPVEATTHKTEFNDYIRKGTHNDFIQKSLNSGAEEGGVLLVPTLYNKIINEITARSPMRQLASSETISSNALDIVIEDGKFSCGWIGDMEARNETTTSKLKQHRIFVHELYAQPKASQTLIDDSAIRIENWLIERLRDSFVRTENDAFINGDGNKKPKGILLANNAVEKFEMGGEVTAIKLLDFLNSLDEEYLANASFLMNRATLAKIQKLQDNNGHFIWQQSPSDSFKQTIFGVPVVCCSAMPTIAENEARLAIAVADFKSAYKIVDRSGINIMRDPYTDKPFVKFYAVKRVGGDIVNPKAIKLAKFG